LSLLGHDGINNNKNLVPKYSGMIDAGQKIYKMEGIKGLYKGAIYTLFAQSVSSSLFFGMYEYMKLLYKGLFLSSASSKY
jgi:hypothetical protein